MSKEIYSQKIDFKPEEEIMDLLRKRTAETLASIKKISSKDKLRVEVFVGGSFAKNTLVKKNSYDIDVFLRLDKKDFAENVTELKKIAEKVAKKIGAEVKQLHGSRDYYQLTLTDENVILELIPVMKIKRPEEAENVTDLSYFHVNFIKRKLNTEKLRRQVRLAKAFCAACETYGAESYIQGFSGYALECLIVHYKSFDKMLRELGNAKETILIDSERHYRNKKEIAIQLNESKLQSPVIVIDPTWKKRNALASLSRESFAKFQKHAQRYLKSRSSKFFDIREVDKNDLAITAKKLQSELLHIELETDKQEGDIAGTKLKKASNYILQELTKEFDIKQSNFVYDGKKKADFYIIGKPKKELILRGPPVSMIEHAVAFRREHKSVFEKKGKLYARKQVSLSLKQYFNEKISKDVNLELMSVTGIRVI